MTEPRESPLDEPEDEDQPRATPSRRFSRLVGSPAARRIALPRLAGAAGAGILVVGLAWVGGSRLVRSVVAWTESQPEYQLDFSEITLDPPPPAYIRTGAAGILHKIRIEARREERFSIPSVNLGELGIDFPRSPWVEKVQKVERGYRGLVVRLVYRKPVAVAEFEKGLLVVIDGDGVILPGDDIEWVEKGPTFLAQGLPRPLILIWGVKSPASNLPGLRWRRVDVLGAHDEQVLGAARLAEFLQRQPSTTPGGKLAPNIVSIRPDEEFLRYFIYDEEGNCIFWNQAPGAEPIGGPSAQRKWSLLVDHVDNKRSLETKGRDYLYFAQKGLEFHKAPSPAGRP